jgi:hypothetical protein
MQASAPPGTPPLPAAAYIAIAIFTTAISLLIYIVLPVLLVWFYRSQDVRRTLEYYDPAARWTDRCPIPVLGMSMWSLLGCAGCMMSGVYLMVPVFGTILTGVGAVVALLAVAATFAISAVLIFRLRIVGCWMNVALTALLWASAVITFVRVDVTEFASAIGFPPERAELLRASPMVNPIVFAITGLVMLGFLIGYTIYLRRYMAASPPSPPQ